MSLTESIKIPESLIPLRRAVSPNLELIRSRSSPRLFSRGHIHQWDVSLNAHHPRNMTIILIRNACQKIVSTDSFIFTGSFITNESFIFTGWIIIIDSFMFNVCYAFKRLY
ncbi:hypothetical protein CDAR_285121 [Caerostris darwini]|uniref:Uncharacterized protein n=1 Tax=Caerostris darwini TaxID=1538125 RepID=A0AAV4VBL3_9ARAC|nr:hypothetical protein CDAR_285121 [Caerostris darwini]